MKKQTLLLILLGLSSLISSAQQGNISAPEVLVPFPLDWEKIASGPASLCFILDKPAGKSGFLHMKDGHFFTPEGNRFRLWGVNLTGGACYPEKEDAPKVASLLASLGINAIRFHFLDSNWGAGKSIFQEGTPTTRELDPEQLDRLDFFVSELKKQGIYSNFNLNVGRTYREGDNVPYYEYLGFAKAVTLFDDRIIELEKEYATQLLTHLNPYTGTQYRNEPALGFLEIVNENSLVEAWFGGRLLGNHDNTQGGTWIDIPSYYADELTRKYNQWLRKNLTLDEMRRIRDEAGAGEGEPIPRLRDSELKEAPDFRFHTEARFIMETENAFYTGMYHHLKETLGVNQWVAANSDHNHEWSGYALVSSTSNLDFVDGHVYWQHPNYYNDPVTGKKSFSIENTPMVNDPLWSTVVQLSRSAVEGKPYTVSETNHPYPNEYSCEGILILGAYALLQDWDGIYFYTFEHDDPSLWKEKTPSYFDLMNDPVKMANLQAGALMFHRGDVQPALTTVLRDYDGVALREGIRKAMGPKPYFTPGFSQSIPLVYKTRIRSFGGGENNFPKMPENSEFISETSELRWIVEKGRGAVEVNTPNTQALIGFSTLINELATENLSVELDNPFVSVVLTSLDEKPIKSSDRLLLTLTSRATLSGAWWNSGRTSVTEWGELPFLIEPVTGKVSIMGMYPGGQFKISPLDGAGQRSGANLVTNSAKGILQFELNGETANTYLIEVE